MSWLSCLASAGRLCAFHVPVLQTGLLLEVSHSNKSSAFSDNTVYELGGMS